MRRKPNPEASADKRMTRTFNMLAPVPDHRPVGEIKLTFDHDPEGHTVKVIVFGIRGFASEKNMDLYVKIYIQPDSKKLSKKKTNVERNTLNPMFNETFVYHLDELAKKLQIKAETAEISLWHDGGIGKTVLLGKVDIPLKDVFESGYLSGWFPLFEDAGAKA